MPIKKTVLTTSGDIVSGLQLGYTNLNNDYCKADISAIVLPIKV